MRRTLIFVFLGIFLLVNRVSGLKVVSMKWFDNRVYFGDLVVAESIFGETVASMVRRSDAIYGVNATYFTKDDGKIVPIGDIYMHLQDMSMCSAPPLRGYFWQTNKPEIGFHPPKIAICIIPAGPIILLNGTLFPSYPQNFDAHHWNACRLRTVVALKGDKFYIFRIYGSLWAVGKYLHKHGFTSAINLDGGSSSVPGARVANAFVVYPKTRKFYQEFSAKYFPRIDLGFPIQQNRNPWEKPFQLDWLNPDSNPPYIFTPPVR